VGRRSFRAGAVADPFRRIAPIACGALLILLAYPVHAAPLFRAPFLGIATAGSVDYLVVADVNADGQPDLVTATRYNGTVRVLLGLGGNTFAPPVVYGVSQGGSPPIVTDLNGDGKLDIAIADFPNVSVGILPGQGDGTFGDTIQVYTGFQAYTVAVADFNGDGMPDLAAANWTSVMILLGNANGKFGAGISYPTATNAYHLEVGDLSGDGKPDVIACGESNQISVLIGAGDGTFQPYVGMTTSSYGISGVASADATGDGKPDVIVRVGSSVSIFPGNGDGTFQPRVDIAVTGGSGGLDVGDVNGDGNPDLVVASGADPYGGTAHELTALLGDGSGGFPGRSTIETALYPADVDIADVDGDGSLDLVAACSQAQLVALHLGNGDGTFGHDRRYTTGAEPRAIALGDLDGDSRADLVVVDGGSASISVRRGNGDGTFGVRVDYDYGLATPRALALGDLDGDARADVAVADPATSGGGGRVTIFSGYSSGLFASTVTYPMGLDLEGIATGDLDGDGDRDLVVTDEQANRASVMINSGGGAFLPPVHYGAGNGPVGVATGDLNGDSKLDVVTANREGGSVTILFGAGDGTFASETELETGPDCRAVAIGFVNGDALPDLVTANGQSGTASVLLGMGAGLFAPAIDLPTGLFPTAVAIADLDGDAKADLVLGNGPYAGPFGSTLANTIGVMLGTGTGSFGSAVQYGCGDMPEAIALADLDGSGGLDIVTANRSASTVTVLMHTGSTVAVPPAAIPIVALRLGQSSPNPAPASLAIRFTLPRETEASLRVYDMSGRLIRTLEQGTLPAGEHLARWDRHTEEGPRAAAGVYFYELRAAGQRIARRLVLL